MKPLNPLEAVFGFAAWLSTRDRILKIGATENCGGLPELVERFAEINNLSKVTENYPDNLIHPKTIIDDCATDARSGNKVDCHARAPIEGNKEFPYSLRIYTDNENEFFDVKKHDIYFDTLISYVGRQYSFIVDPDTDTIVKIVLNKSAGVV